VSSFLFGSKLGFRQILNSRFDGVHAFGCNSAESEPICMQSGALLHSWGWRWQILGAICVVSPAGEQDEFVVR